MKALNTFIAVIIWVVAVAVAVLIFLASKNMAGSEPGVVTHTDTVITHDTVRLEVPKPYKVYTQRYDTARLSSVPDSVESPADSLRSGKNGTVIVPIERKEYSTGEYKAVVEGWRPALVSIEVYPKTVTIRNTETKTVRPRWVVAIGPGVGASGSGGVAYIGITAGFVLWSR